jgi:hypothetical protein
MANREFIAAKDLPVTEAEEVNVLVVDPATGEMAQKAGANLGGEKIDLVIKFESPAMYGISSADNTTVTIESGSMDAVVDALASGRAPVVKVKHCYIIDKNVPIIEGGIYDCSVIHYGEHIHFFFSLNSIRVRISMGIDSDFLEVWFDVPVTSEVQII